MLTLIENAEVYTAPDAVILRGASGDPKDLRSASRSSMHPSTLTAQILQVA